MKVRGGAHLAQPIFIFVGTLQLYRLRRDCVSDECEGTNWSCYASLPGLPGPSSPTGIVFGLISAAAGTASVGRGGPRRVLGLRQLPVRIPGLRFDTPLRRVTRRRPEWPSAAIGPVVFGHRKNDRSAIVHGEGGARRRSPLGGARPPLGPRLFPAGRQPDDLRRRMPSHGW